jgi:mannose PTS system EIIA component
MPGLLIIAHAPLATALRTVGAHVYPDVPVMALDVAADAAREDVEQQARRLLAKARDPQALILTDVAGATPCNVAQQLADGDQVRVVVGVNVPMLWRAMCYSKEPVTKLADLALAGASDGAHQVDPLR